MRIASALRRLGRWAPARDLADLLLPTGCISCGRWIPQRGAASVPAEVGRSAGRPDVTAREWTTEGHLTACPPDLVCVSCRARLRSASWPRCARCHWPKGTGRAEPSECRACAAWPPSLSAARFAHELAPPADDIVHALKYDGWKELAIFMGAAVAHVVRASDPPTGDFASAERGTASARTWAPAVVVPVPTTADRFRRRGYNQAALLADEVARRLGLPVVHALRRSRAVASQTALTPEERRRNVLGVFEPTAEARILLGRSVLLVDDVLTTGATVSAAAERLAEAGAERVVAATFARALDHGARGSS